MKRGIATFTLDYGKCPPWLFQRMVALGQEIVYILVDEYGPSEFVKRIADPVWFQSLGTVLAFDWNASGLTTILTAALKEAIREEEKNLGIFICGGKGKTSRKTPSEILNWGERLNLPESGVKNLSYNSKMAAKVDSSLVQDGYQIYHHAFLFSVSRIRGSTSVVDSWAVVQQGMNTTNQTARRYHWYDNINLKSQNSKLKTGKKDFTDEPHKGIVSQAVEDSVLNMVAKKSKKTRDVSTQLTSSNYNSLIRDIEIIRMHSSSLSKMVSLKNKQNDSQLTLLNLSDEDFRTHPVLYEDFNKSKYLEKILQRVTYQKPKDYESFLAIEGVGPKTVRALSLVAEVIYGARPSYEDPARYSFALGGKDSIPYPVDRSTYDSTISLLERAIKRSKIASSDKEKALRRLMSLSENI